MSINNCKDGNGKVNTNGKKTPTKGPGIAESDFDYGEQMSVIAEQSGNQFMKCHYAHIRYLEGDGSASIVLSHLLNLLFLKHHNTEDRQRLQRDCLWFRCPFKEIRSQLGMGEDRLRHAIRILSEGNLIETCHWAGKILWIRIDTARLKDVVEQDSQNQKRGNPVSTKDKVRNGETPLLETGKPSFSYTNNLTKKENTVASANADGDRLIDAATNGFANGKQSKRRLGQLHIAGLNGSSSKAVDANQSIPRINSTPPITKKAIPTPAAKLSQQLYEGLRRRGALTRRVTNLAQWTKAFRDLLQDSNFIAIRKVIDLHIENINRTEFWPEYCSGVTFCRPEAYQKILNAIARLEKTNGSNNGKCHRKVLPDGSIEFTIGGNH